MDWNRWKELSPAKTTRKHVLDNGLVILCRPVESAGAVAVGVIVKGGRSCEQKTGVAHFVEHMVFEGRNGRERGEIYQLVGTLGGKLVGFTFNDCTNFIAALPARHLSRLQEIVAEMFFESTFSPGGIEQERSVILHELHEFESELTNRISTQALAVAFPTHYLGRQIGDASTIHSITRDELLTYHRFCYTPHNICMAVVGDLDPDEVIRSATALYEPVAPEPAPDSNIAWTIPTQKAMAWHVISRDQDGGSAVIIIEWPPEGTIDNVRMKLLGHLLCTGDDAYVNRALMESGLLGRGRVWFQVVPSSAGGVLLIGLAYENPRDLRTAALTVFRVLRATLSDRISPAEVDRAKNSMAINYFRKLQDLEAQANTLASYELLLGGYRVSSDFGDVLMATNAEALVECARRYLREQGTIVVVSGNTAFRRAIESLPVEVHNVLWS